MEHRNRESMSHGQASAFVRSLENHGLTGATAQKIIENKAWTKEFAEIFMLMENVESQEEYEKKLMLIRPPETGTWSRGIDFLTRLNMFFNPVASAHLLPLIKSLAETGKFPWPWALVDFKMAQMKVFPKTWTTSFNPIDFFIKKQKGIKMDVQQKFARNLKKRLFWDGAKTSMSRFGGTLRRFDSIKSSHNEMKILSDLGPCIFSFEEAIGTAIALLWEQAKGEQGFLSLSRPNIFFFEVEREILVLELFFQRPVWRVMERKVNVTRSSIFCDRSIIVSV